MGDNSLIDKREDNIGLPEIKGIVNHSTESTYALNIIVSNAVFQNFD